MFRRLFGWSSVALVVLSGLGMSTSFAEDPITQPSVGRTVLVCDQWQWIGNGAVTWGCLTMPRRATVAGGQATDEVLLSLQNQIHALRAEIEALKRTRE